jgi:DNA-binding NarL/FixJ family response regulator
MALKNHRPTEGSVLGDAAMISVLLVDDQPLARAGLKMILTPEDGFEIVGECGDGASALAAAEQLKPMLVVMDVRMPGMDGVEATVKLRAKKDAPFVLILTTFNDEEVLSAALRAGANGFVLKDAPADEIICAAHEIAQGNAWLDPSITARVLSHYRAGVPAVSNASSRVQNLTSRELDVLRLMGRGATNQEIAQALSITETTVKSHVGHIFDKLRLRDRAAAIVFAFDHGLVQPTA